MLKFKDWIEKISKETLYQKYVVENMPWEDCRKFFGLGTNMFARILRYYDIKKPMDLHVQNIKNRKKEKWGDENYNNQEKRAETCLELYGVDNQFKRTDMMEEIRKNNEIRYGSKNNIYKNLQTRIKNSGDLKTSYEDQVIKTKKTVQEKYHVDWASKAESVKESIRQSLKETFQENWGCDNYWVSSEAKRSNGSRNSHANNSFEKLLIDGKITYKKEFLLENRYYDFKVGNYLIEINPSATHNSTWSPWCADKGIDRYYHADKTDLANKHNFRCIHVWDWDDQNKIVKIFLEPKEIVGARKCELREVSLDEEVEFLNSYHLQGYIRSKKAFGLYYKNELVMIMTFTKPRYSKKYEWELLRLCSSKIVIGGAQKLLNHFIDKYQVQSLISYCDLSKFSGKVYDELGFKKIRRTISKHWYNIKLKDHITDKLLFKYGFDALLGKVFGFFGKGTSNEQLMLDHGFVEIYDCGQATYVWSNSCLYNYTA